MRRFSQAAARAAIREGCPGNVRQAISYLINHAGSAKKAKRELHRRSRHATRLQLSALTFDESAI